MEILLKFENQQILSPVIIPKITSKIVLDIKNVKGHFQLIFTQERNNSLFLVLVLFGLGCLLVKNAKRV